MLAATRAAGGRRIDIAARNEDNTLGLVGFIFSIVGILSCGILCPIGAILSFCGCFKEPKGLAIAGLVIGLLGSLGIILAFVFFGVALAAFFGMALGLGIYAEVDADSIAIQSAVSRYVAQNNALPANLQALPGLTTEQLTDPWGNRYIYTPDSTGNFYTIATSGPDGKPGTKDDVTVNQHR